MENWVYILNPHKDTLDDEPSDPDTVLRLAENDPHQDLWLSQRNCLEPGDRLWFFCGLPESAVAAVAEVGEAPRPAPRGAEHPFLVSATLLPAATRALHAAPVYRVEVELRQVRSPQEVKP